jgi:hypothetical protein
MKSVGNALLWIALTIGLPGALWSMTLTSSDDQVDIMVAHSEKCNVCRHCASVAMHTAPINDPNIILISPGYHPTLAAHEDDVASSR